MVMKTLSLLLLSCLTALSVLAQNLSTATITVRGTRTERIIVDGQTYDVTNNTPIVVSNLQPGQHTLQLVRANDVQDADDSRTFYVRSGYDLMVTVNNNGSIQLKETKIKPASAITRTPMTDAAFNVLYNDILKQWRSSARTTSVTNAIANSTYYFTSAQARQLIQLVNAQSSRLKLAKSAYAKVTDPANFSLLYDLLNSKASKDDLVAYVNRYNQTNPNHIGTVYSRPPMSDANFSVLYDDVQDEYGQPAKVRALSETFSNASYDLSSAQARQLLELISSESDRLFLAKAGYARVVDQANYYNQLYSLLNSQSSRNALAAHISTYNVNGESTVGAMTSSRFNTVYYEAQQKYPVSAKVSYLSDLFANTSNTYTTSQARQLIMLVPDESNRLYLSKIAYRGITDKHNFTSLYDVLGMQSSRDELAIHTRNYDNGITNAPVNSGIAMSSTEFGALYKDVQSRFGFGAKMSRLSDIFNTTSYRFSTAQARELILLVSSESNRLDLAKASYDNIVDPANFTQLYDVLASQSSRDQLAAHVRSFSSNAAFAAMSDASYSTLYNSIANSWGIGVKYSRLTEVFNNTSYYFSTAQAKKLIELVSSESNRLQLAKLSFDNITDTENFRLIYDVLASQSSRNELAAYVNDHTYKG
jgi:hypothetical protein